MLLLHVRFAREDAAKRGAALTVPELADTLRRLGYAVKIRTALGGGSGGACLRSLRHSFLTVSVPGPSGSMAYVLDPRFRDQFEIAHATPRYARVLAAVGPELVSSQDRLNKVRGRPPRAAAGCRAQSAATRRRCRMLAERAGCRRGSRRRRSCLPPLVPPACTRAAPTPTLPSLRTRHPSLPQVVEILCSEMARAFAETGTPLPPWRQHAAMLSKWAPRRSEEVDVTAALNNGAGLLLPPPAGGAPAGGGVPPGAKRLTGPSTVAQRLMMLGVVQQQSNPSPIAEGIEQGSDGSPGEPPGRDSWGGSGGGGAASTSASSASSLHLDWDDCAGGLSSEDPQPLAQQQQQQQRAPRAAPALAQHHPAAGQPVAVPQRTASGPQGADAGAGARGRAILEGIRAAAAALPHRRNNTWAG